MVDSITRNILHNEAFREFDRKVFDHLRKDSLVPRVRYSKAFNFATREQNIFARLHKRDTPFLVLRIAEVEMVEVASLDDFARDTYAREIADRIQKELDKELLRRHGA